MRGMFKKCLAGIMAMVLGAGLLAGCAQDGVDGKDGETPYIGENGNWWIGTEDTGVKAEGQDGEDGTDGTDGKDGEDGLTPHIGPNGNWWIGDEDTGVPAEGQDGQNGEDGEDGLTPYIGENGNWWIGEEDTGVQAEASDGLTPYIGENGNWWIGEEDTGVNASGLPQEERVPTDGLIFQAMTVGGEVGYVVTDYLGDSPSVVIPDYVGHLHVLGIHDSAFVDTPVTVTQVSLSKFTETIGDYAFSDSTFLVVEMRDAPLRVIGDYAFENCLTVSGLSFPETMERIGTYAFYDTVNLTSLTLDPLALSKVPSIGAYAFHSLSVPFLYLSQSVEIVGKEAFGDKTIMYSEKEVIPETWGYSSPYEVLLPLGGWTISQDGKWIAHVDEDGSFEVGQYIGEDCSELIVPAELDGRPVRSIGFGFLPAFGALSTRQDPTYVRLSEGIRSIGFAFASQGALVSVPASVTEYRYLELDLAADARICDLDDYKSSLFWAFAGEVVDATYFGEFFVRYASWIDADEIVRYSDPDTHYSYGPSFFFVPEGEGLSLLAAIEPPFVRYLGNLGSKSYTLRVPSAVGDLPVLSIRKASVYSETLLGCVLEEGIQEVRSGAIVLSASSSYLVLPDSVSRIAMGGVDVRGKVLSESLFQPDLWDSQWCADGSATFHVVGAASWQFSGFFAFTLDEEGNATLERYLETSSTISLPRTVSPLVSTPSYPCVGIASGFYEKTSSSSLTVYVPSSYVNAGSGAFISSNSYTTSFYFEAESLPAGFARDYYQNDYSAGNYYREYFGQSLSY